MGLIMVTYVCAVVFGVAAGVRIYKQWRMPLHVRWELYPVKHEKGEKAAYGGSYMENPNWWEAKRARSLYNELKFMIPEILLLRGLREQNRSLWKVSFPFHLGLYFLLATLVLLCIGALAELSGVRITPGTGSGASFLYYLTILSGFAGLTTGTAGTAALFRRRFTDAQLRAYSGQADYLNLFFFLLFFAVSLLAWLFHDSAFDGARAYVCALLTFGGPAEGASGGRTVLGSLSIILASLLFAYIPLTHMAHMFMKYFLYHSVRWEDEPNLKGGILEAAILKNLGLKPTWAAAHIGADGKKTWGEIATSGITEKK